LDKVGELLEDLKMSLTSVTFLPTSADAGPGLNKQALLVARDVMEIGAQHSVAVRDVKAFKRYMAILKTYYMDYAGVLDESAKMYELMGLNLICLLSQNLTAEFHTELELLPPEVIQSKNPYILCPVRLEQFIMEGSYNKVIDLKENVPSKSYSYFVEILLVTIRDEIASCMEKAYEEISAKECQKMLNVDQAGLARLVEERGWHQSGGGSIKFISDEEKKQSHVMEVPAKELAEMAITYAKEMEQIV